MAYDYANLIEDCFSEIIQVTSSLGKFHQEKVLSKLKILAREFEKKDKKVQELLSKGNKEYTNDLEKVLSIMQLHGYSIENIITSYTPEFIKWFLNNAIGNPRYRARMINTEMLLNFAQMYNCFRIDFDREPNSYNELRDYIIRTDEVMTKKHEKELKQLQDSWS